VRLGDGEALTVPAGLGDGRLGGSQIVSTSVLFISSLPT